MESMTLVKRIRYLVTEPWAWMFSTAFALCLATFALALAGLIGVASVLAVIVALQLFGLSLARTDLRFIYHRAALIGDDSWQAAAREADLQALKNAWLEIHASEDA